MGRKHRYLSTECPCRSPTGTSCGTWHLPQAGPVRKRTAVAALRTGVEDMPSRITAKLRELGFDEEYKGFQYLVYLLGRVCEEYLAEGVAPLDMQALYQETADRFGIRYRTVESILHFLIRRAAWWGVNVPNAPVRRC